MLAWKRLKQRLAAGLRAIRVLGVAEHVRFVLACIGGWRRNRSFRRQHPDFVPPPAYEMFDAYNHVDWHAYWSSGRSHAEMIARLIDKHAGAPPRCILDWGCGSGRVIRHLPGCLGEDSRYFGTDYNPRSIAWSQRTLAAIRFSTNGLAPPLDFPDEFFDCIYGISVLTHLSEPMHFAWLAELKRALKPGGILITSTHGHRFRDSDLSQGEQRAYDAGALIVRAKVREGSKWYSAYHPPQFMRERLLSGLEILEHVVDPAPNLLQDLWVARKPPHTVTPDAGRATSSGRG